MKKIQFIIFIGLAISCTNRAPQLPANKSIASDSIGIAIQTANQRLIEGEDSIIANYISTRTEKFKKTSSGLWIYSEKTTQTNKLNNGTNCKIRYSVYSLSDKLLDKKTEIIVIGKKQVVNGIEEALLLMTNHNSAVLVLPWYLGYGMKGNENVPPYTTVVVKLEILK
ncbi:MAG: FKBP-type peptidyl-prolyl cis-trans isomerase [Paludibacter sp.]